LVHVRGVRHGSELSFLRGNGLLNWDFFNLSLLVSFSLDLSLFSALVILLNHGSLLVVNLLVRGLLFGNSLLGLVGRKTLSLELLDDIVCELLIIGSYV
jgi:hypothetical protein